MTPGIYLMSVHKARMVRVVMMLVMNMVITMMMIIVNVESTYYALCHVVSVLYAISHLTPTPLFPYLLGIIPISWMKKLKYREAKKR